MYMYEHFDHIYIYILHVYVVTTEHHNECQIPWNWSYRISRVAMMVLETDPRSSLKPVKQLKFKLSLTAELTHLVLLVCLPVYIYLKNLLVLFLNILFAYIIFTHIMLEGQLEDQKWVGFPLNSHILITITTLYKVFE